MKAPSTTDKAQSFHDAFAFSLSPLLPEIVVCSSVHISTEPWLCADAESNSSTPVDLQLCCMTADTQTTMSTQHEMGLSRL